MTERWKTGSVRIRHHDGTSTKVEITASSWGRVADLSGGHTYGTLQDDGYRKVHRGGLDFNVNRVICTLFHGAPPSPIHQCDHIDSNRSNNMASNLRWILPRFNVTRAIGIRVQGVDSDGKVLVEARSLVEAHEKWPEATAAGISACINGDRKSAGGLAWRVKKK